MEHQVVSQEEIVVKSAGDLLSGHPYFAGVTIRGKAAHVAQGEPVYREYGLVNFFRQFELNERVDASKISAELKNGVLTLSLPKAEEAKPRKIDVRTA